MWAALGCLDRWFCPHRRAHTPVTQEGLRAVGEQLLRSGGRVRAWLCGSSAHLWVELTKASSYSIRVSEGLNQTWPLAQPHLPAPVFSEGLPLVKM